MPLYEYQCEACGHRFEVIQKFSDPHLDTCPKCGGVVRKLLSSPAFHFKGSGWYITDYARAGKTGDEGEKSGSKAEKGSGGDAKGETKADAKTESKAEGKAESKTETKSESASPSKSDPKPSSTSDSKAS